VGIRDANLIIMSSERRFVAWSYRVSPKRPPLTAMFLSTYSEFIEEYSAENMDTLIGGWPTGLENLTRHSVPLYAGERDMSKFEGHRQNTDTIKTVKD
jgi:hypothetical protein